MFRSDGSRFLNLPEHFVLRLVAAIRKRLFVHVKLRDRGHFATYVCETPLDGQRPLSLWVKEQGTMEWIDSDVRAGDVFMDIGANIGIYSIAAALRIGTTGIVYAFEPHKVNALSLLRNVQANRLQERIRVFSCALSESEGMFAFNYRALASASTASRTATQRAAAPCRAGRAERRLACEHPGVHERMWLRARHASLHPQGEKSAGSGPACRGHRPQRHLCAGGLEGTGLDRCAAGRERQPSLRNDGNRITSRMLGESVSSITSRSMPMPQPPVGGMPISRAWMKSAS